MGINEELTDEKKGKIEREERRWEDKIVETDGKNKSCDYRRTNPCGKTLVSEMEKRLPHTGFRNN